MKLQALLLKLFFFAGSVLILISIGLTISTLVFISKASSETGTVIRVTQAKEHDNGNNSSSAAGIEVQFQPVGGSIQTFITGFSCDPPIFAVGDKVNVLYDPQNMQKAEIDTFIILWFSQILLAIMGIIFISISTYNLRRLRSGKPLSVTYSMQFSAKEIGYLFSKKKACPECKGNLIKEKKYVDMSSAISKDMDRFSSSQDYIVKYNFNCETCSKTFALKQLANLK